MSADTPKREADGEPSVTNIAEFSDWARHSLEDRSVLQENFAALERRWLVANDPAHPVHIDPKLMQSIFPGQRRLFEILSNMTLSQVTELSQCKAPLFHLTFATNSPAEAGDQSTRSKPHTDFSAIELSCREENLMALATRLDLTHQNETTSALLFGMQPNETKFLRRHNMLELRALAGNPLTRLVPAVTDEFFIIAASKKMDWRFRTAFARTSRHTSM